MEHNNNHPTSNHRTEKQEPGIQLSGMAFYQEKKYFMFSPDDAVAQRVPGFRMTGIAQQMTDGTFDFVARPKTHPQSTLIRKMAHGRVSMTKDGAIQLTLKVFRREGVNISDALLREAQEAAEAVRDYQLRH